MKDTHRLSLSVHDSLELLEMLQLDLQLLHLGLHQQGHQALDAPLLNRGQVLRGRSQ